MRTLIIPCAGSRMIEGIPLFLNCHPDGELIAVKAIQGVFPEQYDKVVFTILKEMDKKYGASEKIYTAMNAISDIDVEIVVLEEKTGGPAETVYKTIMLADINSEFAVRDSHAYIKLERDCRGNFIAGLDLTEYEKPIENLRGKSFVVLNEQKQVLDVVEKHFCSDVISAGLYGFKSASDFKMAYERLSDPYYPINKLYLSHIISYLIGYSQRVFHSVRITEFEDWSTKAAWQKVQKAYATCFLDLCGVCGKEIPFEKSVMDKLITLSNAGVHFVGFVSENVDAGAISEYLKGSGVNIINVVSGCSNSKIRTLVLSKENLNEMILEV